MINNYIIWDKVSPINGSSAEDVLASDSRFKNNITVFFCQDKTPVRHAFFQSEPTNEELDIMLLEFQQENQEQSMTLEQRVDDTVFLKEENNKMKEALKLLLTEEQIQTIGL